MFISKNIIHLRKTDKITQSELSEQLGIVRTTLSKYENGDSMPDVIIADKIATIFDISIDDLCRKDLSKNEKTPATTLQEPQVLYQKNSDVKCKIIVNDDGMYPLYMIGDTLSGKPINDFDRIINNKIYVIEFNDETLVRQVKKMDDKRLFLFPFNKLSGEGFEVSWNEISRIISVTERATKFVNIKPSM